MAKEYSSGEVQEFRERDLRIVRQNALSHATSIAISTLKEPTPDTVVDVALALADRFVTFVYGSMASPVKDAPTAPVSPGAKTTNTATPSAAPGVVKNIQVSPAVTPEAALRTSEPHTVSAPVPSDREKEVLRKMAYSLAPDEPGKVVDLEEFTKRVYEAFGKYPGNIRSLELFKQKITVPYVEV